MLVMARVWAMTDALVFCSPPSCDGSIGGSARSGDTFDTGDRVAVFGHHSDGEIVSVDIKSNAHIAWL
jgi:hypothetical protein